MNLNWIELNRIELNWIELNDWYFIYIFMKCKPINKIDNRKIGNRIGKEKDELNEYGVNE